MHGLFTHLPGWQPITSEYTPLCTETPLSLGCKRWVYWLPVRTYQLECNWEPNSPPNQLQCCCADVGWG